MQLLSDYNLHSQLPLQSLASFHHCIHLQAASLILPVPGFDQGSDDSEGELFFALWNGILERKGGLTKGIQIPKLTDTCLALAN